MSTGKQIVAVLVLWIGWSSPAAAQPTNGDFDNQLTGWSDVGDVAIVTGTGSNNFAVLSEPGDGGRSRIAQNFTLANPPGWLSFRYRLSYGPSTRQSTVPPDALMAFLRDGNGDPLVVAAGDPPAFSKAFSKAFFYTDSDGKLLFNSSYVQITGPDGDDAYTAVMNLVSLTAGTTVSLEFGLASGNNTQTTHAIIDDIRTDCPPGYCCDALGNIVPLDDGDPCTADSCDGGVVSHTDCPQECAECNTKVADIVIVLDRTGSTSTADMQESKRAAKGFLDFFGDSPIRPRIVLASFNGPCATPSDCVGDDGENDTARLLGNGEFTSSYGADGLPGTGLYSVINAIPDTPPWTGFTDLSAALNVARVKLESGAPESPKYIVVISDGVINYPPSGCNACNCSAARTAATDEVVLVDQAGITIVAVHYIGHGNGNCTENQALAGHDFLRDNIATSLDYFFEGTDMDSAPDYDSELFCVFYDVMQTIACDDDIECTVDSCVDGACVYDDSGC